MRAELSATLHDDVTLDRGLCASVGAELARVRTARGLSVQQVSEQLLLSTRQVRALEQVDLTAFHNATFYLGGLRKYARFAGVDPVLVDRIGAAAQAPPVDDSREEAVVEPVPEARRSRRGALAAGAAIVVLAASAWIFVWPRANAPVASPETRPQEPPPAIIPLPPPEPPPPPSETAGPAEPAQPPQETAQAQVQMPAGFGALRVPRRTWIFVRDADGGVIERTLADGESIELESQPVYLATGIPDAELTIGTRRIDVAPFVANGQVRIRAGDFDALVQGASPIPAPTAAAR